MGPFLQTHLANKNFVLHTDGARAYKTTAPGFVHDRVVHMKKPVCINGKRHWIKPHFSKMFTHELPNGETLECKGGTQIIDRFWRTLRSFLNGRHHEVGSSNFERRIRSCQWCFWNREGDQWVATGNMLAANRMINQEE